MSVVTIFLLLYYCFASFINCNVVYCCIL